MIRKKLNKFLAGMMMSVMLFNSAVPYYANAEGEEYISGEENMSENEMPDTSDPKGITSEEGEDDNDDGSEREISVSEDAAEGDDEGSSIEERDIDKDEKAIEENEDDNNQPEPEDVAVETLIYGDYKYQVIDSEITITGYTGFDTEIVIPSQIDGYPVKTIGVSAFKSCLGLTSVVIPEYVEKIEYYAFQDCLSLTDISFDANLKEIGSSAFGGCTAIQNIDLPEGLEKIGSYAFEGSQIKYINIPSTIKNLGYYTGHSYDSPISAFSGCGKIETIEFADGIKEIPQYAVASIPSLIEVKLPQTVTYIKKYAFWGDTNLSVINLPDSITEIYDYAFYNCKSLSSISLAESLKKIDFCAFKGCVSLNSIKFNDNLKEIDDEAFYGCTSIQSIDLPEGLQSIGENAFKGSQIEFVKIPSTIKNMHYYVGDGTYYSSCSAFSGCGKLETIEFADGIKVIPAYAAAFIPSLKDVKLPEGLVQIEECAFQRSKIKYVKIPSTIKSLDAITEYDGKTFTLKTAFFGCGELETIEFADGIKIIPSYAAAAIPSLIEVKLPQSVTIIKNKAFSDDSNLYDINLPDGITEIGNSAFLNCVCLGLGSVTIPQNTKTIYPAAFKGCYGLTSVSFNSSLEIIGEEAFSGCAAIHSIDLPEGLKEIGNNAFKGSQLKFVKIPSTITKLGGGDDHAASAFSGCYFLKKIEFAEGLEEVPSYGGANIVSLNEVILPKTVTLIKEGAFYSNPNLEIIKLPDKIMEIQDKAFLSCVKLCELVIPNNCKSIGNIAFKGCTELEVLKIPRSVNFIASDAFLDDNKLTIYGYADSYAQYYANEVGIPFIVLDGEEYVVREGFDLKKHGYCVINAREAFNYEDDYKFPLERYQDVFGNVYTQHIYDQKADKWGGNCFGMSATAAMFCREDLDFNQYITRGTNLNESFDDVVIAGDSGYLKFNKDSKLTKLIEQYQIWRGSIEGIRAVSKDKYVYGEGYDASSFANIVSLIRTTKEPFILEIYADSFAHALVVDSSRDPDELGNDWTRIYLYDPNHPYISGLDNTELPTNNEALNRYIDVNTINGQWHMVAKTNGNGKAAEEIGYIDGKLVKHSRCQFVDVNNYPLDFKTKASLTSIDGSLNISYHTDNVIIYDKNDELVYKKANGTIEYINSDIVYDGKYCGYVEGLEGGADEGMLILPQGQYKIIVDDGMIAFGNNGDYAGVVTDNNPITVTNTASNALSVSADNSASVNIVVMDSYAEDKFTSIETDVIVSDKGCEVSLSENILDIDTNDDQKFDVDIITEDGHGEIKDADSDEVENTDIDDYVEETVEYKITYDLDGGIVTGNPETYTADTESFTLINPTKEGYVFKGWTGSNGNIPQIKVVIEKGTKGNLSFKANWKDETSIDPSISANHIAMNPVPEIYEDTTELHLIKGQKFTLPDSGWTSLNKKYVAISKKNVLTAKKVTAEGIKITKDGREITIYISQPKMVKKSIKLDAGTDQSVTFDYDADNLPILWYSNAPDVATISHDGVVTAHCKGTATITAYIYGKAYTCKVKVAEPQIVQERTIHMAINKNKTVSLKGIKKPVWKAEDETVVSVKGSKFKGLKAGDTIVSTEYEGKTYQIHVYVEDLTINVTDLNAKGKDKYTAAMKTGDKIPLSYNFVEQDVVFKSSKGEVAYWDDGAIVAQMPGKAKLNAKVNGKTITINVIVAK